MTGRAAMTQLSMACLAMALAASGCKKPGGAGDAIAKLTELRDKMCACKDKACTDKVSEEMTRWGQDVAKAGGDQEAKRSEEDTEKMKAATEALIRCQTKIVTEAAH